MNQANELFHSLNRVDNVFEEQGSSTDGFGVGFKDRLWLHDKSRETYAHEGSSRQELFKNKLNDILLISFLFSIDKNNRSFFPVNFPVFGVKVEFPTRIFI